MKKFDPGDLVFVGFFPNTTWLIDETINGYALVTERHELLSSSDKGGGFSYTVKMLKTKIRHVLEQDSVYKSEESYIHSRKKVDRRIKKKQRNEKKRRKLERSKLAYRTRIKRERDEK